MITPQQVIKILNSKSFKSRSDRMKKLSDEYIFHEEEAYYRRSRIHALKKQGWTVVPKLYKYDTRLIAFKKKSDDNNKLFPDEESK